MQGETTPPTTVFSLSLWMRIGMATLFFTATVVSMWKRFLWFGWVPWFCLGLHYLTFVPRQKGEATRAYFTRPRSIVSVVLLLCAIAGVGYNLHVLYAR